MKKKRGAKRSHTLVRVYPQTGPGILQPTSCCGHLQRKSVSSQTPNLWYPLSIFELVLFAHILILGGTYARLIEPMATVALYDTRGLLTNPLD